MSDNLATELNKQIEAAYSMMFDYDKEYYNLFESVVNETETLGDVSLPVLTRYKLVVSIEFILIRIRILVSREQVKVKSIIANQKTSVTWVQIFKKRDMLLASYQHKLLELRDDLGGMQKLIYTLNTYNFK